MSRSGTATPERTVDVVTAALEVRADVEIAERRIAEADFGLEMIARPVDPPTDEIAARLHFARTMAEVDAFFEAVAHA